MTERMKEECFGINDRSQADAGIKWWMIDFGWINECDSCRECLFHVVRRRGRHSLSLIHALWSHPDEVMLSTSIRIRPKVKFTDNSITLPQVSSKRHANEKTSNLDHRGLFLTWIGNRLHPVLFDYFRQWSTQQLDIQLFPSHRLHFLATVDASRNDRILSAQKTLAICHRTNRRAASQSSAIFCSIS